MARIPRDLTAEDLIKLLIKHFDYKVTRQIGSHIRLRTNYCGHDHQITIPNHAPIKIGTLNSILNEIAVYLGISKVNLVDKIFR